MRFLLLSAYTHVKPPHETVEAFYLKEQPKLIQKTPPAVSLKCHDKIHARAIMVNCPSNPPETAPFLALF